MKGILAATIAVLMATASGGSAQQIITLAGQVRNDVRGIPGAHVTAYDSLTNERRSAVADERGFFRMIELAPGRYAVSARAIGHAPTTEFVHLGIGERAQVDLMLERTATVLETVHVAGQQGQILEVQRMSVSTAVAETEIRNLPLNNRNIMELAAVAPGIRSFRTATSRSIPASGPLRDERFINLYLDGVEMKNLNSTNVVGSPQTGSPVPADALQEFRVMLNTYDAEFTRGSAFIISAATHRGTNQRHGSAFGFFQNKSLISVTDFQRRIPNFEQPDFSRSQAGFSLRGPFVRDRLFYAVSYEVSDTKNFIAVVPGRPPADPTLWDSYAGVFKAPSRNQTALSRLTFAPNTANLFDGIWSLRYTTGEALFGGQDSYASAVAQKYLVNTVKLRHRWLPSPRLANELSFQFVGWSHQDRAVKPGPELRYPTLRIGRTTASFDIDETQLRLEDRLTYSLGSGPGSHLLKTGLSLARVTHETFNPINALGSFIFRTETATPHEGTIAVGLLHPDFERDAHAGVRAWIVGGYLSDEWQLNSRVVLNLGLRYDVELGLLNNDFTVPWASDSALSSKPELKGLLSRGDRRNDLNNFSPRASFSWDVSGNRRTFVRGGFGIMYDRVPGNPVLNEQRTALWRSYTFPNPGTTDPSVLRARVLAGGNSAAPSIVLLPNKMESPENRQWSVGIGTQPGRAWAINMDFVYHDVSKVLASVNLNWVDVAQTPRRRALSSSYGNIIAWGDFTRGRYRSLLTSIRYSPDTSTRITLAHTLASARAEWDEENVQVPAGAAGDFYSMQRISGDERHRFVLSAIWMLRYGVGISTVATLGSPRPYRTYAGQDANQNNFTDDDWIDGRRYALPSSGWKSWYRMVDLRLAKAFAMRGGTRLSVTAEAFNLFNTENYSGYFGVQKDATGQLREDFGTPSGIFATRQLQIGSRLEF